MPQKYALIVDDSRTAQARLSKLLGSYDLTVDTANSAEEALTYLSDKLPAVVFMDHLMPGMDGFEALKAIKSNPETAVVPIIMYTSKSGDVYIGQARALGAIDVLSKDDIGAGDLEKLLANLHITPRELEEKNVPRLSAVKSAARPVAPVASVVNQKAELHGEIAVLKEQILHLFQNRVQDLKEEFSEHFRQLTRQIQSGFQRQTQKPLEVVSEETALMIMFEQQVKSMRRMVWLLSLLVVGASVLLSYWLYDARQQQALIKQDAERIVDSVESQYETLQRDNAQLLSSLTDNDNSDVDLTILANTIAWAISLDGQFEFGKPSIGEKQFVMISELVSRLSAANFAGVVRVGIHHGNFCVVASSEGDWVLPASTTVFEDCRLLSTQALNLSAWSQHSRAFTNFLTSSPLLQNGKIRLDVELKGMGNPLYPYSMSAVKLASDWNKVAALNNRLSIEVIPVLAK